MTWTSAAAASASGTTKRAGGVVEAPGFDDPVWVHFSVIDAAGYRALRAGAEVELTAERVEQDGYRWRATWVRG